jgi:hypothetical protein
MEQAELQQIVLKLIKATGALKLGMLRWPAIETVHNQIRTLVGVECNEDWYVINEAVWALVARRLAYIAMSETWSGDWRLMLTARGHAAAEGSQVNPDDPSNYMKMLIATAPDTTETVRLYLDEALKAFTEECYLSSAVMLGVAAEACSLETADAFTTWAGKDADKLRAHLKNPRTFYVVKLEEFQKRLATAKSKIPSELSDSLDLYVNSVLQLIRLTRNEAGHPTNRKIDRDECFNNLVVYAGVHKRLHLLKNFFLPPKPA